MKRNLAETGRWKELLLKKGEFQAIVRTLVKVDERFNYPSGDPEGHFMRKAISFAREEHLRIFIRDTGGFVYQCVVELKTPHGSVMTVWIHEDEIPKERDALRDRPDHPVHTMVCVTDLYAEGTIECDSDALLAVESGTFDLLFPDGW